MELIMETAEKANNIWGNELYQERARRALPILVRQAEAKQSIYYSNLADELDMANPRNLNYVLGCIGQTLVEVVENSESILSPPPIQCLVTNKSTDLPGDGIEWFIDKTNFNKLDTKQKRELINTHLSKIFEYEHWRELLNHLNLKSLPQIQLPSQGGYNGGGEGEKHKALKKFIANNPSSIGLPKNTPVGETEFNIPSGDSIDVVFQLENQTVAVEVKSSLSNNNDLVRGLYQTIKYQAVCEAMHKLHGKPINVRSLLAIETDFPKELNNLKNTLGLEVITNVGVE